MKKASLNEMLEKEKEKLNRLADEALKDGIPFIPKPMFYRRPALPAGHKRTISSRADRQQTA